MNGGDTKESWKQSENVEQLCQLTDADISTCACQAESQDFSFHKDCIMTDVNTTSTFSNTSVVHCFIQNVFYCKKIE